MARNDGMAIVSLDDLRSGPVHELFERNLVQIFRIGQINESTAELCLTVLGWKTAQKLRYPCDDGDSAHVEVLSASDSVVQAAKTAEFLKCGGQILPSASSPTDDEL